MSFADQLTAIGTQADDTIGQLTREIPPLQTRVNDLETQVIALLSNPPTALGTTQFGACLSAGEAKPADIDAKYAVSVPVVRMFGTTPLARIGTDPRSYITSFKQPLNDTAMLGWFSHLKSNDYWCYWHEPEDDIARGNFTAADYRAKWAHLKSLAKQSGTRARATLILMFWTLDPQSKRNWADYYPGDDVIDVMGWDFDGLAPTNVYPAYQYGFQIAPGLAAVHNKPWLVAEYGCARGTFDADGSKRAALFNAHAHAFACSGARAVCLWDNGKVTLTNPSPEYTAWRSLVATGVAI